MWAFIVFLRFVSFAPEAALHDAYQGPGRYYWRVDFAPGDVVQSAFYLEAEPEDYQELYDEYWQRIGRWAERMGHAAPHDGCWIDQRCPPAMIRRAEVQTEGSVMEAGVYFLAHLLRSVFAQP
jgi:hypothetical protein